MTGTMKRMKSMTTTLDADHSRNELFDVDAKGNETKIVVIEYTRK